MGDRSSGGRGGAGGRGGGGAGGGRPAGADGRLDRATGTYVSGGGNGDWKSFERGDLRYNERNYFNRSGDHIAQRSITAKRLPSGNFQVTSVQSGRGVGGRAGTFVTETRSVSGAQNVWSGFRRAPVTGGAE